MDLAYATKFVTKQPAALNLAPEMARSESCGFDYMSQRSIDCLIKYTNRGTRLWRAISRELHLAGIYITCAFWCLRSPESPGIQIIIYEFLISPVLNHNCHATERLTFVSLAFDRIRLAASASNPIRAARYVRARLSADSDLFMNCLPNHFYECKWPARTSHDLNVAEWNRW